MILDVNKANELLNRTGMPRREYTTENDIRDGIFKEMVYLRFQDGYDDKVDEDLDEELHDFIDTVQFEMKDLDYAIHDDEGTITLYVSYRADPTWDQHMEVVEANRSEWMVSMEQAWEYRGSKTIQELREEFDAAGGTWSETLLSYFL